MQRLACIATVLVLTSCGTGGSPGADPDNPQDAADTVEAGTGDVAEETEVAPDPGGADTPDPGDLPIVHGAVARVIASPSDLIGGRQAAAVLGDILMINDHVRFVIRTQERGLFSPFGGNLVDADLVRADGEPGHDRLLEMFAMVGFGRALRPTSIEIADDGSTSGTAVVRVRGTDGGIPLIDSLIPTVPLGTDVTLDYVLGPDARHVEVVTRLTSASADPMEIQVGQILQFGKSLEKFADRCGPDAGCLVGRNDVAWLGAAAGDVSYGFTTPAGSAASVVLAQEEILLVQTASLQVPGNGSAEVHAFFLVGDGTVGDIARGAFVLRGSNDLVAVPVDVTLGDASTDLTTARIVARVHGSTGSVGWASSTRPGSDGRAWLNLAPGTYDVTLTVPGAPSTVQEGLVVAAGTPSPVALATAPAGRLHVLVRDGAGKPIDAFVSLQPGHQAAWDAGVAAEVLVRGGEATAPVLPGEYTATVSKGFEFGMDRQDLTVEAGKVAELAAVVSREVDTTGWISMDTHDHCEMSIDSDVPVEDRVDNALAVGVEIVSTTDHDHFGSLQPTIDSLGVGARVHALLGDEISPLWGHTIAIGCQPVYDYDTYYAVPFLKYAADGTVERNLTPSEVWTAARQDFHCGLLVIAHPWEDQALFLQFPIGTDGDPAALLPDLDLSKVDGLEVVNSHDDWGEVFTQNIPG